MKVNENPTESTEVFNLRAAEKLRAVSRARAIKAARTPFPPQYTGNIKEDKVRLLVNLYTTKKMLNQTSYKVTVKPMNNIVSFYLKDIFFKLINFFQFRK